MNHAIINSGNNEQFVGEPNVVAPFTTIQNRAKIEANCKVFFGNERVIVNSLNLLPNEFGPSGERVFESDNKDSRVRFVGSWKTIFNAIGTRPQTSTVGDFVEITSYGTGLNILAIAGVGSQVSYQVDNGALTPLPLLGNPILANRNYKTFNVYNIANGLTKGWHTYRIYTDTLNTDLYGFELVNTSTTLDILAGSIFKGGYEYKVNETNLPVVPPSYTGSNGGRVLVAVNPANSQVEQYLNEVGTPQFLGSTDHSNEAIYRKINFREFGRNRGDDFSTASGTFNNKAFTLDDGTTTLLMNTGTVFNDFGIENLSPSSNGNYFVFTFTGTGLDFERIDTGTGTNIAIPEIWIDGVLRGSLENDGKTFLRREKICSGLEYGSHTVRLLMNGSVNIYNLGIANFIVYRPKKPTHPSNAIILTDYNLTADFSQKVSTGVLPISQGVLRKVASREITYLNGNWSINLNPNTYISGFLLGSQNNTSSGHNFKYTFFGTGFEFIQRGDAANPENVSVALNGTPLNNTNFPTATYNTLGSGLNFDPVTGVLDLQATGDVEGASFTVKDLPLGVYTVEFTKNTTSLSRFTVEGFDVITPIHAPNTTFGSLSLEDKRNDNEQEVFASVNDSPAEIFKSSGISQVLNTSTGFYNVYLEYPTVDYPLILGSAIRGGKIFATVGTLNQIDRVRVQMESVSGAENTPFDMHIKGKPQKDVFKD
jgi:hypothetical protein